MNPLHEKTRQWLSPKDALYPADLIFVFGSHTLNSPAKAAQLFQAKLAPKILVTGKSGTFGNQNWTQPIAMMFKQKLLELGIPQAAILVQAESTNTLEDVTFSRELISSNVQPHGKIIIVAKPIHQLRAYLTIKQQLPQYEYLNCPAELDPEFDTEEEMQQRCRQELERIRNYGEKGDIVKTVIPDFAQQFLDSAS